MCYREGAQKWECVIKTKKKNKVILASSNLFFLSCFTFILPPSSLWFRILFTVCLNHLMSSSVENMRAGDQQDSTRRDESARKKENEREKKKGGKVFVGGDVLWVLEGKFVELQGGATEFYWNIFTMIGYKMF